MKRILAIAVTLVFSLTAAFPAAATRPELEIGGERAVAAAAAAGAGPAGSAPSGVLVGGVTRQGNY